jgi:hypothetical protein
MLPAIRTPVSPTAPTNSGSVNIGASGVHTQLGSSSSLAHRYCIPRDGPHSPSTAIGSANRVRQAEASSPRDQLSTFLSESDAESPSTGGASVYRTVMNQMPATTNLFARVQLQHEQQVENRQKQHLDQKVSPAAAAVAAAGKTIDGIHYHLLEERVTRIETAIASLATTVSQLVQLLSVAAESSPQAAAAIWSTAAQLSAEVPAVSSIAHALSVSEVGSEESAYELSHHISRGKHSSCSPAVSLHNNENSSETGGIAAPEFNLRHKIARVAEVHERLCSIPSGLPSHQSVRVLRQ